MIELDGSQGEGGGQILRTALALSLITGQPFRIDHIRAKRPKPGLMRQHLACVQAAAAVGGADVEGAGLGSQSLRFKPGAVRAGEYEFAIASAGSCMLVLQTVLWPLMLASAPSTLTLRGGTHNPMAPSLSFLQHVTHILCRQTGGLVEYDLRRHGFYPAGGGEVRVQITPALGGLKPLRLMQRGALRQAWAECLHAGIPKGVAVRELAVLQAALGWPAEQLRERALRANEGPGNALLAVLEFEHITEVFASYGDKGVSAEQVAQRLVKEVRAYLNAEAPVGPHLADQWMIPLALAGGGEYLATEVTEHTRTNARVIEAFMPQRFAISATPLGQHIRVV
jgi:RNA 3'-terminal phosphate cyclase (ATP)